VKSYVNVVAVHTMEGSTQMTIARRMVKKVVRRGRSEVREATNKEPHVCGRARVGERPVSGLRGVSFFTHHPELLCSFFTVVC
jgi:hypothetical protein